MSTLESLKNLMLKTEDEANRKVIADALWILETIHINDKLTKPEINRLIEEN